MVNLKKYRSFFILSVILAAFISGFYVFSGIYTLSSSRLKTVVLGEENFPYNYKNTYNDQIKVKNVEKYDTTYPIGNFSIINNESIAFVRYDGYTNKTKSFELCIRNFTNKDISSVGNENVASVSASQDGKKLLYTYSSDYKGKVFNSSLYDVENKRAIKTMANYTENVYYLDNNRYIEMYPNNLYIKNFDNNEILFNANKVTNFSRIYDHKISYDGNKIYFLGVNSSRNNEPEVCVVNLKNNYQIEHLSRGNIWDFGILNNGNLAFIGSINGENGIFTYNVRNNNYRNVIQGKFQDFSITPEGKIAYIIQDSNGINEIHAGIIKNDKLISDKVVYSNLKYISFLKWSQDGKALFCVNNSLNLNTVYKFTFCDS